MKSLNKFTKIRTMSMKRNLSKALTRKRSTTCKICLRMTTDQALVNNIALIKKLMDQNRKFMYNSIKIPHNNFHSNLREMKATIISPIISLINNNNRNTIRMGIWMMYIVDTGDTVLIIVILSNLINLYFRKYNFGYLS